MLVLLLPLWVCCTGGNPNGFWYVVLSMIVGCGFGLALSGVRQGRWASRVVSAVALLVHVLALVGLLTVGVIAQLNG
jgi:hypothetical protein